MKLTKYRVTSGTEHTIVFALHTPNARIQAANNMIDIGGPTRITKIEAQYRSGKWTEAENQSIKV